MKLRILSIALLAVLTTSAIAARVLPLGEYYPPGVEFGMSVDQLKSLRPAATESPVSLLPTVGAKPPNSLELTERASATTFYIYVIRGGGLQALVRSEPIVGSVLDPVRVIGSCQRQLRSLGSHQIARATGSLEHFSVTADLWKDQKSGFHAYFVSTSEETTLIVFNPAILTSTNFFISADRIPALQATAKTIRARTKTGPDKLGPPLVDRPWLRKK